MAGKISFKQVNGLDLDLDSIQESLSSASGFGETGGYIYGDTTISGNFSQDAEYSSFDISGDNIILDDSNSRFGSGPSGQIWINGSGWKPSIYLEATGEFSPRINFLHTKQLNTGSFSIDGEDFLISSNTGLSFSVGSEEIVTVSDTHVNFNKETSFDGNTIKSSGMSVTQDSLIETVDTEKYSVSFLTVSATASSSSLYERLFFNWGSSSSGMNSGSFCSIGDHFGSVTGDLTSGDLKIYWSGDDADINYIIKNLKKKA